MSFKYYISAIMACLMSFQCVLAQTNGYVYGSPHYWMAQSASEIYAGKFDVAYESLQKAQKKYKAVGDVAFRLKAIEAMGTLKSRLGEWGVADSLYKEALQIAVDCKNEYSLSSVMIDLITLYQTTGNIVGYNHYQKALDSLYCVSTSAELKTMYHIYWAKEYLGRKEFAMTEYQLHRCWDAMQNLSFFDREQAKLLYYSIMMNLNGQQRLYKSAIVYAKKYIEQTGILNGEGSDQQYQAYSDLCTLYSLDNDSVQAFACLDSLERGVGRSYQDKEWTANFYNIKGCCYANFKKYDRAIECFDKAYAVLGCKAIENSLSKFASVKNKAEAYFRLGRYDDAFDTFRECVDARENKFGETSGLYYQTLFMLAGIEAARGNVCEADSLFRVSMNFLLGNMKQLWRYSTPSQREQFWMETLGNLSGMAAFSIKCGNSCSELTETCYNALLFSKALQLETEKSVVEIIRSEGTEADVANYRRLLAVNNRIMTLKGNYEYNRNEIDSLTVCLRNMEQHLSSTCQCYNKYDAYLDIDFQRVRKCLTDNEVLIDFSDYQTDDSVHQYAAYIYDKNRNHPVLIKCFEQQQIDSLLDGMQIFTLYDVAQLRNQATDLIWKTIGANIPKGSTVYYVPSGIVHSIALEALPLQNGMTLGQQYNFVRLTSARELVRRNDKKANEKTAVLYGGLQYSLSPEKMAEESRFYDKSALASVLRSEHGEKGFKNLLRTKEEVEKVGCSLRNNGYFVKTYMGAKGNAESFIALSGKAPSILHIATHGFYYTPEEAKGNSFLEAYTDAMSLSGLVFAGGNAAWLGKKVADGVLGGILTARDIANLDLKGVDMVVLSACKTADGNVTHEGVFGLQRAFKKAGVNTIVMSLWNVDDRVTSEFMSTFYECLADKDMAWNKRMAFEKAKQIIRRKHPDPFHWAAFVMLD